MKAALIALSLCAPAGAYYAGRPPVALRRTSIARPALLDANGLPIAPTVKTVPGAENQDHEITLGELIFSSRDPRLDVATTPELYDETFCAYVEKKADDSEDMEERVALKSLVDMVRQVQDAIVQAEVDREDLERRMIEAAEADGDVAPEAVVKDGTSNVLAAAQAATLDGIYEEGSSGVVVDVGPTEAGLSGEALKTYDAMLTDLVGAVASNQLDAAVEGAFERCDFALLSLATERRDGGGETAAACGAVVEAINAFAAKRLEQAAMRLGGILKAGTPAKMMSKITEMAVTGEVDVSLVELLDANRQQAEAAGDAGKQAAELMKNLANRCRDELDKRVAADQPEKRLLRALLRSEDEESREALLRRAFEPKEAIALGFGDEAPTTQEGPEVEPPKFISACMELIEGFGNIDDNGTPLAERVRSIAALAETIANEIFGECNTPQELQDRMWNEGTTSVFDLEAVEMAAEAQGERMPWQDDRYDDMLPPGFDHAGVKKIGGG